MNVLDRKNRYNRNSKYSRSKILILLIVCLLLSTIAGCSTGGRKTAADTDKIKIVTTIFPLYDFTRVIGGDSVEITLLLSPGMESHFYEPTPRDMVAISECDLFLYIGGESDEWVADLLESTEKPVHAIALMQSVQVREEEHLEGMQAGREEHQDQGDLQYKETHPGALVVSDVEYDEHIWTSPKNAMLMVKTIEEELCKLNEEQKIFYESNMLAYLTELEQLDWQFTELIKQAARKTLVFGDRFPFLYLAKEYGLTCYAAFPGCSAETEASAATIAFLTDKVKTEGIPVILYLELTNHKIADAIAEAAGVKTAMFHSAHNISKKEREAGATYISLMQNNVEVLREALQ